MRRREELRARVWLGHVLLDRVGEEGQARVSLVERPATANCDVSEPITARDSRANRRLKLISRTMQNPIVLRSMIQIYRTHAVT
jgi:hypothetical protein